MLPSMMTGPAATGTITPVTVTKGDDSIPPDSLFQLETFISTETNARFETAKSNKTDFVVEEGTEVDLATPVSVESESMMEVEMTMSVAETVTPVHKVNRSVEVRAMEAVTNACVGIVCLYCTILGVAPEYYYEPVSVKKFRSMPEVLRFLKTGSLRKKSTGGDATPSETPNSKKQKKRCSKKEKNKTTSFYSDCLNPPQSVCWVLTDSSADTWAPFVHGNMVPEGQRQEWDAVFSTVSQRNANRDHRDLIVFDGFLLWCRNRQKVLHLNSVHDVQVWSVIGVVEPVNLKHFTKMDITEKLSKVRAMEGVTNACIGVGCLYCTIVGVAPEV
ncbi:hypothetical protein CQW23_32858 [Capsicum baccatum]|uniref:MBD domain-containing protein n=1 Tax=Capsicum baccatum TaxID=33114 RepID=A0A2G2V3H5_CAPBA|nr:hypothetical protein CQW23_32858 [Capsicum baccatum]